MLQTFSLVKKLGTRVSNSEANSLRVGACFSSTTPIVPTPMFLLTYKYDARDETELAVRRASIRPLHLAHAQAAQKAGKLFLGGASLPVSNTQHQESDDITGVLVFRNCTLDYVEEFAKTDPYFTKPASHGKPLTRSYSIRSWNVVVKPESMN